MGKIDHQKYIAKIDKIRTKRAKGFLSREDPIIHGGTKSFWMGGQPIYGVWSPPSPSMLGSPDPLD